MKWYWLVLIIVAVLAVAYWVAIKGPSANRTVCRPGTCPVTLGDGTIFCTAAACKKDNNAKIIMEEVKYVPTRSVFASQITETRNSGVAVNVGHH